MYKTKRTISVNGQTFDIWLGVARKKSGKCAVYLFTDNPDNPSHCADPIISNVASVETGIRKGIEYAKNLFREILQDQQK